MTREIHHAAWLADKVLDRPNGDPDDDLAVLARQFQRAREALQSIALNTCCDRCQEAALVAQKALGNCERCGKNHYDMTRPTVPTCPFKPYRLWPGCLS